MNPATDRAMNPRTKRQFSCSELVILPMAYRGKGLTLLDGLECTVAVNLIGGRGRVIPDFVNRVTRRVSPLP
jgi:hypothetical protein